MAKPEWGTKRTCPHCGTRFYDLGNDDPVHCIACEKEFQPDSVLKSKQAMPFERTKTPDKKKVEESSDDDDLDLDVDEDEEPSPENEVDLGGDDDLGVTKESDGDEAET